MSTPNPQLAGRLTDRVPFQSDMSVSDAPATVTGVIPDWLCGQLVRTASACFETDAWQAKHWFDGLGMLYSFRIAPRQQVTFRQRSLKTLTSEKPHKRLSFGTPMQRGFFERLLSPIPPGSDNPNVHVLRYGDDLIATSETRLQWVIDPETLEAKKHLEWSDDEKMLMLAHPQYDAQRKVIVNVSAEFGRTSRLRVIEHEPNGRVRRKLGFWPLSRVPYLHSFGLTAQYAVLFGGPLEVNPLSLLFSNKGYIDHFKWAPHQGTRIAVIDRATGVLREHTCRALFTFHVINSFEEKDAVVIDLVAYENDPVHALSVASLTNGFPTLGSKAVRLRLKPGVEEAEVRELSDQTFELPAIASRHAGLPYRTMWGVHLFAVEGRNVTRLVKIDATTGKAQFAEDTAYLYGEPVFVRRPGSTGEQDGVLLTVGSHRSERKGALNILDAATLESIALAEVPLPLPLGFHGSFLADRAG